MRFTRFHSFVREAQSRRRRNLTHEHFHESAHENTYENVVLGWRLSRDRRQDLCDRERHWLKMCSTSQCLLFPDFRAYIHGVKGPQSPKHIAIIRFFAILSSISVFIARSGAVWRQHVPTTMSCQNTYSLCSAGFPEPLPTAICLDMQLCKSGVSRISCQAKEG